MDYTLSMTFVNISGDKSSISIAGVRPDVTQSQTSTFMDTIIAKDVFRSNGGSLAAKYSAKLTERAETVLFRFNFSFCWTIILKCVTI